MDIIHKVSKITGLSVADLLDFAKTCPHRYKKYYIAKRNSELKRLIAQPSKQVKYVQRAVIDIFYTYDLVHSSAYAYKKGVNIKNNAEVHVNQNFILKMDFKDFFPSITPNMLFNQLERVNLNFTTTEKEFLSGLLFWKRRRNSKLRLSIGAPSSPLISNIVMYSFDCAMHDFCKSNNIKYSRYADDLCFSCLHKGGLDLVKKQVIVLLSDIYQSSLKLNSKKTVFASRAVNRHVTGITLTNDGKTSVGRDRKRLICSAVHRVSIGKEPTCSLKSLSGWIAYVDSIEGDFFDKLQKKYGKEVIERIFHSKIEPD